MLSFPMETAAPASCILGATPTTFFVSEQSPPPLGAHSGGGAGKVTGMLGLQEKKINKPFCEPGSLTVKPNWP